MSEQPWYQAGLNFTCSQCGDCCTGAPGVVWVSEEEIAAIAAELDVPVGEIRLMHTRQVRGRTTLREYANGDCTFFDPQTRGCKVYGARPTQCRTWPFWRSNLESPETWNQVQAICPGSRGGAFVSLEEIEHRASQIDL